MNTFNGGYKSSVLVAGSIGSPPALTSPAVSSTFTVLNDNFSGLNDNPNYINLQINSTTINSEVVISNNSNLENISGLVEEIKSLTISNNSKLNNINLSNLRIVNEKFKIENNNNNNLVIDLSSLDTMKKINLQSSYFKIDNAKKNNIEKILL